MTLSDMIQVNSLHIIWQVMRRHHEGYWLPRGDLACQPLTNEQSIDIADAYFNCDRPNLRCVAMMTRSLAPDLHYSC